MSSLGVRIVRAQAHYSASRFHEDGVDLTVSHAEFAELIEQVKADAWDEGAKAIKSCLTTAVDGSIVWDWEAAEPHNPYRKQEEA